MKLEDHDVHLAAEEGDEALRLTGEIPAGAERLAVYAAVRLDPMGVWPAPDPHVTIVWAEIPVVGAMDKVHALSTTLSSLYSRLIDLSTKDMSITLAQGVESFGDDARVMLPVDDDAAWCAMLNRYARSVLGPEAVYTYPAYRPHVTLGYGKVDESVNDILNVSLPIIGFDLEVHALVGDLPIEKSEGFVPPKGARSNAKRGLELRRKHGRGGTAVGVARARDIARGASLSRTTIGRMVSFFARHEGNQEGGEADAGYIAWLLWGGDAGKRWANSIWNRINKSEDPIEKSVMLPTFPIESGLTTTTAAPFDLWEVGASSGYATVIAKVPATRADNTAENRKQVVLALPTRDEGPAKRGAEWRAKMQWLLSLSRPIDVARYRRNARATLDAANSLETSKDKT